MHMFIHIFVSCTSRSLNYPLGSVHRFFEIAHPTPFLLLMAILEEWIFWVQKMHTRKFCIWWTDCHTQMQCQAYDRISPESKLLLILSVHGEVVLVCLAVSLRVYLYICVCMGTWSCVFTSLCTRNTCRCRNWIARTTRAPSRSKDPPLTFKEGMHSVNGRCGGDAAIVALCSEWQSYKW